MVIIRLILGAAIGFCLGNAFRIRAEVRRKGSWNDQDAQECFFWLFMTAIGVIVFTECLFLK